MYRCDDSYLTLWNLNYLPTPLRHADLKQQQKMMGYFFLARFNIRVVCVTPNFRPSHDMTIGCLGVITVTVMRMERGSISMKWICGILTSSPVRFDNALELKQTGLRLNIQVG